LSRALVRRMRERMERIAPSPRSGMVHGKRPTMNAGVGKSRRPARGARREVGENVLIALEAAIVARAALIIFEVVEYAVIGFMPLQAFEGMVVMGLAAYHRLTGMRPPQYVTSRTMAMDLGSAT
jgi:hypothetical protein